MRWRSYGRANCSGTSLTLTYSSRSCVVGINYYYYHYCYFCLKKATFHTQHTHTHTHTHTNLVQVIPGIGRRAVRLDFGNDIHVLLPEHDGGARAVVNTEGRQGRVCENHLEARAEQTHLYTQQVDLIWKITREKLIRRGNQRINLRETRAHTHTHTHIHKYTHIHKHTHTHNTQSSPEPPPRTRGAP